MSKKKPEKLPSAVSNFFISGNEENNENADDSIKYFKSNKSTKPTTSSAQTSSAVSGFINKYSASPKRVTKKTSVRKPAISKKKSSQPDLRKLLCKDDQKVLKIIEAGCREDNLDPDDVQLALALSESMKEQQPETKGDEQKLKNPFQGGGKVQSVSSVLEKFGFKTGKGLSEFEQEMLTSKKFSKRSKFQKAPTVLTRTSKEEREENNQQRIVKIIEQETYKDHADQVSIDIDIYSPHLQDFHMQLNSIVRLENMEEPCDSVIQNYYVTDLFTPSYLQPDHLLKDWNQIPGRDRSPQKLKMNEDEKNWSHNSSSSDIFADVESFNIDSFVQQEEVSQHLETLHEKLNNTEINEINTEPMEVDNKNISNDSTLEYEVTRPSSPQSPIKIDLLSSEDEIQDLTKNDEICDLTTIPDYPQNNSSDVIDISDDEVNYSTMQAFNNQSDPQNEELEVMEIENISNEDKNSPIKPCEEITFQHLMNQTSELLNTTSVSPRESKSNQSMQKFLDSENLSDSLQEILRKYGGKKSDPPKRSSGSFRRFQSESSIKLNGSNENNVEDVVDLTQNCNSFEDDLENFQDVPESSINKSFASIMNSPLITAHPRMSLDDRRKTRKSLMTVASEKFEIDSENNYPEPDFRSMTPAELKQELFKYGIRSLPVKKATELLQHIYDSIHPKIRVASAEEIDANDSRMDLNYTDVVSNIACNGDDDDFVFQFKELDGEEYILPSSKKSKMPSCAVPLQISFYNMVRSNQMMQKYILEFRPLDLDMLQKHFKRLGTTYQANDIIAFLDKRCITFKTKDKSYSKTHEAKKQKRLKRSQKN